MRGVVLLARAGLHSQLEYLSERMFGTEAPDLQIGHSEFFGFDVLEPDDRHVAFGFLGRGDEDDQALAYLIFRFAGRLGDPVEGDQVGDRVSRYRPAGHRFPSVVLEKNGVSGTEEHKDTTSDRSGCTDAVMSAERHADLSWSVEPTAREYVLHFVHLSISIQFSSR